MENLQIPSSIPELVLIEEALRNEVFVGATNVLVWETAEERKLTEPANTGLIAIRRRTRHCRGISRAGFRRMSPTPASTAIAIVSPSTLSGILSHVVGLDESSDIRIV